MKNSETIGNRTRDLPARSATAYPRDEAEREIKYLSGRYKDIQTRACCVYNSTYRRRLWAARNKYLLWWDKALMAAPQTRLYE